MSLRKEISKLMNKNAREKDGNFFTVPSPTRYPFQWLWDSCFHAEIYIGLKEYKKAEAELASLFKGQRTSGHLPHIIFWNDPSKTLPNWGRELKGTDINELFQSDGMSNLTQPPLIARTYYNLYQTTHNKKILSEVFSRLHKYYEYLNTERTLPDSSLLIIVNPDESGEDNAHRFDEPLSVPPDRSIEDHLSARIALMRRLTACDFDIKTCMQKHFAVIDLSFNCIYADSLRAMAQIALALGDHSASSNYNALRARVLDEMREHLSADGTHFVSRDIISNRSLPATDWTRFMPLYAKMVSTKEARHLVEELFDDQTYWSRHGIRTLSKQTSPYDPAGGFWRGPVWHAPHFFIYRGLQNYGFTEEAARVKDATMRLITEAGFYEHYNGETGKGYGAENFTWGGLYVAMD